MRLSLRDNRIDILRFIGLIMIMLAHIHPDKLIMQIRNFDVPLMVLISGFSYHHARKTSFINYVQKRIVRLVQPVWLFLAFYFLTLYIVAPNTVFPNVKTILTTFLFIDGIGYVWIIRIFLLIAIFTPILVSINNKIKSTKLFWFAWFCTYFSTELLYTNVLSSIASTTVERLSIQFIIEFIVYTLIFLLGYRIINYSKRSLNILLLILGSTFLVYFMLHYSSSFQPTQLFKYPPQIYYSAYSITISLFLWRISDSLSLFVSKYPFINRVIRFMAQNSIWIYLWHIPFIEFVDINKLLKFSLTLVGSFIMVTIQIKIIKSINQRVNPQTAKKLLGIFTG